MNRRGLLITAAATTCLLTLWGLPRFTDRSYAVPRGVDSIGAFLDWRIDIHVFAVVPGSRNGHVVAVGPEKWTVTGGSPAYVFDATGRLVDWSSDIVDDSAFESRWKVKAARKNGQRLERSALKKWFADAALDAG